MRGTTDFTKKILSILIEFALVLAAFFLSGLIRVNLPFGMYYDFRDTLTYSYMGIFYAVAFIFVNYLLGSYGSLKTGKIVKEFIFLLISDIAAGILTTSVIYLFRLEQISRAFLAIFLFVSTAFVFAKRILLSALYMKYSQTKGKEYAVVVGNDSRTEAFLQFICQERSNLDLKGYFAQQRIESLDASLYLGDTTMLSEGCLAVEAKHIFVVQGECAEEDLMRAIACGAKHGIAVSIIPSFERFLPKNGIVEDYCGAHTVRVHLFDTSEIMGVNVAVTNMEKTTALICDKIEEWRGEYICVANVHTTVTAYDDSTYRRIQNDAVMVLPDGGPLSAYSREHHFEEACRVTGPDLLKYYLETSGGNKYRHFFYGSTQETLDSMREHFEKDYPDLQICGMYSPPFRELTEEEDRSIIQMINDAKADFVWVGLGAPKQEIWMNRHKGRIQALMIGVGAAFDYEAGNIKRAPGWMQEHSLEWLYRLLQNPVRLFKRYFVTNTKYLLWKFRK